MKIDFPTSLKISQNKDDWDAYIEELKGVVNSDYLLLTGVSESYRYSEKIVDELGFQPTEIVKLESNSVKKVYELEKKIRGTSLIIVAIGGGKVCDLSKRLAYFTDLRLVLIPTVIANDGLISPISVLADGNKSFSLPGKMPNYVFIDMNLIKNSPSRFLIASACDLLSNLSATSDWEFAAQQRDAAIDSLALQFSSMAAYMVLDCNSWDLMSPEFLRAILHGQILSAMAMAYAGNSRPCSGSEHLICHAIDDLGLGSEILHGEKVGRASLFCLHIQKKDDQRLRALLETFDIPTTFTNHILDDKALKKIFERAREVRPGRRTILDSFSCDELVTRYNKFQLSIREGAIF